ncbi:MAG: ubiquinol-cytochrome c reductase iron-sulfur subunit [Anaerolineae bacterium]
MSASTEVGGITTRAHSRRSILRFFFGFTIVSTLVGVLTPIIGYLFPPATESAGGSGRVKVGSIADIPIGQAKVVPMGNNPVIVINTEQGVKAFSAICTHLACVVTWSEQGKFIQCPCHDARFNPITGAVMAGPAQPTAPPTACYDLYRLTPGRLPASTSQIRLRKPIRSWTPPSNPGTSIPGRTTLTRGTSSLIGVPSATPATLRRRAVAAPPRAM